MEAKDQSESVSPNHELNTVVIPTNLISEFQQISAENTLNNIETGGILLGGLNDENNQCITHTLIPKQQATANAVYMEKEDDWSAICDTLSLQIFGWIHTHPEQTCFMSSIDLHSQYNIQRLNENSIGIVVAPTDQTQIFSLTSIGMDFMSV